MDASGPLKVWLNGVTVTPARALPAYILTCVKARNLVQSMA
jgi:hypothetical protein